MLNNAKQILVSELVLAEHAPQEEVEQLVENKINISFDEYKLPQEHIDINQDIVSKFIPFNGDTYGIVTEINDEKISKSA